jgi:hypothetical protein
MPAELGSLKSTSSPAKAENRTMPMPFRNEHAERVYLLTKSRSAGRRQAGTSCCGCSLSRLGSSRSEKGTTERPPYRAHS